MTRTLSPKLVAYVALAAVGLVAALALRLQELVVVAAPFALLPAVSLLLARSPRIETEVERLLRRDAVARELAITYRQEIIPAAAEALSIVRFSLEQGEASLLSWLEARRSYLETLRASYAAQREAFLTRAELERLTGEFDAPESQ